jgi:hypothetical protein
MLPDTADRHGFEKGLPARRTGLAPAQCKEASRRRCAPATTELESGDEILLHLGAA